jgi:hypothetical protein
MIAHSTRFLGKSDEVWAKNFWCMISTAKEGIFKRESTVIYRIHDAGKRRKNYEPLAKILYSESVSKQDRLKAHEEIVFFINEKADTQEPDDLDEILLSLNGYLAGEGKIEDFLYLNL